MFLTFSIFFVTLSFLYYLSKFYSSRKVTYWKKQGVHILKNDLTTFQFLTTKKAPPDFDLDYYTQLGEMKFGIAFELGSQTLFVKDLDLVKQITVRDFDKFSDHRDFIDTDPLFSQSLFFLKGQEWKDMRNFLSPTFTSGKIRQMFHIFETSSEKLLKYVQNQHSNDGHGFDVLVPEVMARFTVDVIGATAFGMQSDALTEKDSVFYKMARRASDLDAKRLMKFGLFTMFPSVGNFFKMQSVDKDVSDFFIGILKHALKQRANSEEKREDFLQLLTEAREGRLEVDEDNDENAVDKNEGAGNKPKVQLTEDLAIQQAFLFFLAGFESVANLLGETAYILAANPEIQQKLYAEVENSIENNGKLTYETANKLEYMEMIISEILRMYLPMSRMERKCLENYIIPGTDTILPKGSIVAIPSEAIHFDPQFYPNPKEFDPERFNAENKAKRNPYTYLPFGIGPRICIGMRLALIEAKVALGYLIHNFEMQPIPGKTPIPVKMWRHFGINRVPYDLHIRMVPRNV